MRPRALFRHVAPVAAVLCLASLPVQASDGPRPDDPLVLRSAVVQIPAETLHGWVDAKCGDGIALPWFDGAELGATVDRVERGERSTTVTGTVEAEAVGGIVLTVGDGLAGAVSIDGARYRLRPLAGDEFSLVQIDASQLMPDTPDTHPTEGAPFREQSLPQALQARVLEVLPFNLLRRIFAAQLDRGPDVGLFETGERIDVLIAVTGEAEAWAASAGLDLQAEIDNMVGKANMALAASAAVPRLHPVGTVFVDYEVVDPGELATDLENLIRGAGSLGDLHALRDVMQADLVSLLVFNGTGKCAGNPAMACGRSVTPRVFPGPGDGPGSSSWETKFAINGFGVMNIYAAFNSDTYTHEIGHNLGAHHDWLSFSQDGYDPTVDNFARGWVMIGSRARTVMAYDRLCEGAGVAPCELLPVFSNPLQPYLEERRGDPPPGVQPSLLGPADNHAAINRMASMVASYRIRLSSP